MHEILTQKQNEKNKEMSKHLHTDQKNNNKKMHKPL